MQSFTTRGVLSILALAIALMAVTVAAVVPAVRGRIRAALHFDHREILAKTSGFIVPNGLFVSVFKISQNGGLALEVYTAPDAQGNPVLLQKIVLPDARDGYVNFEGNATNLMLSDTDHDGAMEIVAPTFDEQMTPRLNVYHYNGDLKIFEAVSAPESTGP